MELWEAYHLVADFPANLPEPLKYPLLVKALTFEAPFIDKGIFHIEFCHYDSTNSPFDAEYCDCKDL